MQQAIVEINRSRMTNILMIITLFPLFDVGYYYDTCPYFNCIFRCTYVKVTLMTSAAADVINHNGRKTATILLGKYTYFDLDLCIFELYRKDKC